MTDNLRPRSVLHDAIFDLTEAARPRQVALKCDPEQLFARRISDRVPETPETSVPDALLSLDGP